MLAPPPRPTRRLARLTVGAALAAYLTAAAPATRPARHQDAPDDRPPASFEDRVYVLRSTPTVDASRTCDGPPADALPHFEVPYEFVVPCMNVGTSLAVVPATTAPDGTRRPPVVAFAAADSIWFLQPGWARPRPLVLPTPVRNWSLTVRSMRLGDDVDGDGAPDLVVESKLRRWPEPRWFLVSAVRRCVLGEIGGAGGSADRARATPDFGGPRQRLLLRDATGRLARIVTVDDQEVSARVVAGAERAWTIAAESQHPRYVLAISPTGDIDGDRDEDLVVAVSDQYRAARIEWRSGRTGELLRTTRGIEHHVGDYGYCLAPYADLDGDGYPETLSTHYTGLGSFVLVLDGRSGAVVRAIDDPFAWGNGSFLDGSVDWDGKGLPDLVVASSVPTVGGSSQEFCILSMEDGCTLFFWSAQLHGGLLRDRARERGW